jgi:hypothetical protein
MDPKLNLIGNISFAVLIFLIIFNILKSVFRKDKVTIWSPITFFSLIFLYYIVVPYFWGNINIYGIEVDDYTYYIFIGALLSYVSISIGFLISWRRSPFQQMSSIITRQNAKTIAMGLFFIALVCYVPFRGFSLSFFIPNDRNITLLENDGFVMYFIELISLLCTSCCLLLARQKKGISILFLFVIWITMTMYIIGGFRYRIVILIISGATVWHLYPKAKKIKYKILIPMAVFVYLFFSMMDHARHYFNGLDVAVIESLKMEDITQGASENSFVFSHSAITMKNYSYRDLILFEPIWCAVTMPVPRAVYPNKPKGDYLVKANFVAYGNNDYGAVFIQFTEAYMAFGWVGIILTGLFIGFFSRMFWDNYRRNPHSLGAVLLLGLFNGFTYILISRGYLAQCLTILVMFVFIPFGFASVILKFSRSAFCLFKYR